MVTALLERQMTSRDLLTNDQQMAACGLCVALDTFCLACTAFNNRDFTGNTDVSSFQVSQRSGTLDAGMATMMTVACTYMYHKLLHILSPA